MIKKFFNLKKACPAKLERSRGFTVLESLVAIMVLSLSIAGVFSAVQQSLSQSIIAKDEVKAFYLAQEAIEIIRNKRDANQLAIMNGSPSATWLDGITSVCIFGKVCQADAVADSLAYCGEDWDTTCPVLKQNPSTFLYSYGSGNDTNFKREIMLEQIPGTPDEISVTVRISWEKGLIPLEFKVKTHLFNWM